MRRQFLARAGAAAAIVLALGVSPGFASRLQPLYQPKPIPVPCDLSRDELWDALIDAGQDRVAEGFDLWRLTHWKPALDEKGNLLLTLDIRQHHLVMAAVYKDHQVHLEYRESWNLLAQLRGGHWFIHRNANGWIMRLESALRTAIFRVCREAQAREMTHQPAPVYSRCTPQQVRSMREAGLSEEQIEAACR